MKARIWLMLGAVVVLGTCYVLFYTEWIRPDPIQIQAQVRDVSPRVALESRRVTREERAARAAELKERREAAQKAAASGQPVPKTRPREAATARKSDSVQFEGMYPVVFALDGEYRLTAVRVIEEQPSEPGKSPRIVWNLTSESNSVPTKALMYGRVPRGMKLKDERDKPAKLTPGVTYRLEVRAGRYQGQTTFQAKETEPPAAE